MGCLPKENGADQRSEAWRNVLHRGCKEGSLSASKTTPDRTLVPRGSSVTYWDYNNFTGHRQVMRSG